MAICRFEYAAKVVCGEVGEPGEALAPGIYVTEINVYNPNERSVDLVKRLAVAIPPGEQKQGDTYPDKPHSLQPGHALAVDCRHLRGLIPQQIPPLPAAVAPYIVGFFVIESTERVDVTAVYTTAGLRELGTPSIAVEQVSERKKSLEERR
jgi:hypothetical protein